MIYAVAFLAFCVGVVAGIAGTVVIEKLLGNIMEE